MGISVNFKVVFCSSVWRCLVVVVELVVSGNGTVVAVDFFRIS